MRCNYCNMQDYIKRAVNEGATIRTRPNPLMPYFPDGVDVYIYPAPGFEET